MLSHAKSHDAIVSCKLGHMIVLHPFHLSEQAQFNHVGTTGEYLHHLCYNQTLMKAFQFSPEVMLRHASEVKSQGM